MYRLYSVLGDRKQAADYGLHITAASETAASNDNLKTREAVSI
jgi:hypothetical protein